MLTAPDEHMPYIIQLHIMNIQPANKAAEPLISSYDSSRKKHTEAANAYLIKNSKGEGQGKRKEKKGGGGTLTSSWKDWAVLWVYKIGLK